MEKEGWEERYDEMIAPLTESTADIKQFIHQLLDEERKRIAQEFADLDIILKKKPNIPMGVSQWRNYGIKYDYYNYFAKQEREKAFREILDIMRKKHLDSDIYNNFFIDLAEEIRQLNKI